MQSKSVRLASKLTLSLTLVLGAALAFPRAQAQTFSVIHNFTNTTDGGGPLNGFVMDTSGNLYGTANTGGANNYGLVFTMTTKGVQTVLYNFAGGSDGAYPNGVLLRDKSGNLYGTTTGGGVSGAGTVFKVTSTGTESILYSFTGKTDGSAPEGGVAIDGVGNLYGTTTAGGAHGNGAVFKLTLGTSGKWMERVLYSFGTGTDGATPTAGILLSGGKIFGTTSAGGTDGYGTVFELTTTGAVWTETILHNFANGDDGAVPYAGLIADKLGNFYGTATEGGSNGGGSIYELSPVSGGYTFSVLYSVPGWGISGAFRDLVLDSKGNLYGTTHCDGTYSSGTVYKLSPSSGSWLYTLLYTFTGGTDGQYVFSNLVIDGGKLYGTTNQGGSDQYGVVFQVNP